MFNQDPVYLLKGADIFVVCHLVALKFVRQNNYRTDIQTRDFEANLDEKFVRIVFHQILYFVFTVEFISKGGIVNSGKCQLHFH